MNSSKLDFAHVLEKSEKLRKDVYFWFSEEEPSLQPHFFRQKAFTHTPVRSPQTRVFFREIDEAAFERFQGYRLIMNYLHNTRLKMPEVEQILTNEVTAAFMEMGERLGRGLINPSIKTLEPPPKPTVALSVLKEQLGLTSFIYISEKYRKRWKDLACLEEETTYQENEPAISENQKKYFDKTSSFYFRCRAIAQFALRILGSFKKPLECSLGCLGRWVYYFHAKRDIFWFPEDFYHRMNIRAKIEVLYREKEATENMLNCLENAENREDSFGKDIRETKLKEKLKRKSEEINKNIRYLRQVVLIDNWENYRRRGVHVLHTSYPVNDLIEEG